MKYVDGFEWAKVDVDRVSEPDCRSCHLQRHAAGVALQPGRDHHCRGRLGDRHNHMPGGRRPLCPGNVGVTEDWG